MRRNTVLRTEPDALDELAAMLAGSCALARRAEAALALIPKSAAQAGEKGIELGCILRRFMNDVHTWEEQVTTMAARKALGPEE